MGRCGRKHRTPRLVGLLVRPRSHINPKRDGGVGFASYLAAQIHPDTPLNALSVLLRGNAPRAISRAGAEELRILELGAGIGSAGLALAHLLVEQASQ